MIGSPKGKGLNKNIEVLYWDVLPVLSNLVVNGL